MGKVTVPLAPSQKIEPEVYKLNKDSDERFWREFSTLIDNYNEKNDDFLHNFKIQLENLDQHTINYNFLK